MTTMNDVKDALGLIAEGTPYQIKTFTNKDGGTTAVVLVQNDLYLERPDEGHDPFIAFPLIIDR